MSGFINFEGEDPAYVVQELWGDQWLYSSDFFDTKEEAFRAAQDIRESYEDIGPCTLRVIDYNQTLDSPNKGY